MKKYAFLLVLAVLFIGCEYEDDYFPETDEEYDELVEEGGSNEEGGDNEDEYEEEDEGGLTLYRVHGNDLEKVKDYPVAANLISYQQDYARHFEMWDFVTRLFPLDLRGKIVEFEVFHGGDELLGYVTPIDENDLSKWRFALAIDAAQDLNTIDFKDLFTFVTIHEYAHVLTLSDEQVEVSVDEWNCPHYFTGEGCSRSNAYINQLYELGWADIIDEHDPGNPYDTYDRYPDRFVSDYAATNPGEDVAEVFSFFITQEERPTGNTIADRKIQLMYTFPELVEIRNRIRANGDVLGLRAGSLGTLPSFRNLRKGKHAQCRHHVKKQSAASY